MNAIRIGWWAGQVLGALTVATGALLAGGGVWLLLIGGSRYYVLAGVGYIVAGALLWRRRAAGAWLVLALLGATIGWALWEVGLDYRAFFPHVFLPATLAVLALATRGDLIASRSRSANPRTKTVGAIGAGIMGAQLK